MEKMRFPPNLRKSSAHYNFVSRFEEWKTEFVVISQVMFQQANKKVSHFGKDSGSTAIGTQMPSHWCRHPQMKGRW